MENSSVTLAPVELDMFAACGGLYIKIKKKYRKSYATNFM